MVAASTVPTVDVVLNDVWPDGASLPHIPTSGFTGSDQNNVEDLPRGLRLGTKVKYYDVTSAGEVTMIYLRMGDHTTVTISAGDILRPAGATDNTAENLYVVNNDPHDAMFAAGIGPAAIAISAITDDYYIWAWCGGPVPQDGKTFCSVLAAASIPGYLTAGNSAASAFCAGDCFGTDENGLVEPDSYLQSIFGWIPNSTGATAS